MTSSVAASVEGRSHPRLGTWWPAAALLVASAIYLAWSKVVIALWSYSEIRVHGLPLRKFEGYARWDAGWYFYIATKGYYYNGPGHQSAVAFFPSYPVAVRAVAAVIGDALLAGVIVTIVAGAAVALLLHRWVLDRFDRRTATLAVVLLLVWPYAYYLFGVMYSDALFIACAIGAFVLLERGHPWLAACAGIVATAARPVGIAVAIGLFLRSLERDGVLVTPWSKPAAALDGTTRRGLRAIRLSTIAPAASIAGLLGYIAYLWYRFNEPFAFAIVASAPGWERRIGPRTIAKFGYAHIVARREPTVQLLTLTVSALLTFGAIALLPRVLRQLGVGYAAYAAIAIGLPFASSSEFLGMGRYVLAAFPCFAVAAGLLRQRPRALVRGAVLAASALLLALFSTLFIRGYYLS